MLPSEAQARLLKEREVLGLMMTRGAERRIVYFEVQTVEGPNDLEDYSLGSASAMSATGTGWQEITDSSGRYHLEPEHERIVYHFFFGVSPPQARIYRRYPTNEDVNSLLGTRAVGGAVGFIDGLKSPYRSPSALTETFTLKGQHPSFLGYHPYAEPSSITVRQNFYVTRYDVAFLGVDPGSEDDQKRVIAPDDVRRKARVRPLGGHRLVPMPSWVESAMRRG